MCRCVEALLTKMIFITATAPVITMSSLAFKLLRNSHWPGGQLFLVQSHSFQACAINMSAQRNAFSCNNCKIDSNEFDSINISVAANRIRT